MKNKKQDWRPYQFDECICGSDDIEVFTYIDSDEGYVYDEDPVRCNECKTTGAITVYAKDDVCLFWHK